MTRKILITGASTGIGAATALCMANAENIIGIHYNSNREAAEAVSKEVRAKDARPILLQGDLSSPEPCERLVRDFAEEAGGIDVLVNNAGTLVERGEVKDITWDLIDRVLRVNLYSTIYVAHCALPYLQQGMDPVIINVGSIASRHGAPTATIYGAAKAGIHSFTRGLARELAPKIRVNAIAPGVIETPFHEQYSDAARMESFAANTPLARNGKPEEIAGAIAFLASAEASFITGETLDVNGGLFMR